MKAKGSSQSARRWFARLLLLCAMISGESSLRFLAKAADDCGLYLAESSIKNGGFGVFAGRDYAYGERIGEPGIGVQVTDPGSIYDAGDLLAEFGWNSIAVGGDGEADAVFSVLPGIGMLANFHPILSNIVPGGLTEDPVLRRGIDPGAGASTAYHNFTFIASGEITAGQELFASIGEGWFSFHDQNNQDDGILLKADHDVADKVIRSLAAFREEHTELTEAQFLDVLFRGKNEMIQRNDKLKRLIPDSVEGLLRAAEQGTARTELVERSVEWVKTNGKCLDNIRGGLSTIEGAGRGAFAKRFIPKGSIITPAPLVHVLNKGTFNVDAGDELDVSNMQLLLNYCFGHRESPLLLCPTTSAALINHRSDEPNAEFRWSESSSNKARDVNYRMAPLGDLEPKDDMISEFNSKLSFDIIATRDIQVGEEITMDYGDEWESAWRDHLERWEKPISADEYVPASVLNAENHPIMLSDDPKMKYHSYLCRLEPFAREELVSNVPLEDLRANPAIDPTFWNNHTRLLYGDNDYLWWWPCEVIEKDMENTAFQTVVYAKTAQAEEGDGVIRRFKNVPRWAIKYVDRPYHSDQHQPKTFRHYIPIPDSMFPLHWRDGYVSAADMQLGVKNTAIDIFSEDKDDVLQLHREELQRATCGVYVAPSTIKGAGKGTYLGVTAPGKHVTLGSKVPVLPVVDFATNENWDAKDYTWTASNFLAEFEASSSGSAQILAVNEGCMANFHPGLVNHETSDVAFQPVLDRRVDPGTGAFSDYVGFSFQSKYEVKAGEEAFISYGESWFNSRGYLGKVPLSANYQEANSIVASLVSLSAGLASSTIDDENVTAAVLKIVKDNVVLDERTKSVLSSIESVAHLKHIRTVNGTAEATTERRSLEWLEKHGDCTDHIYSKDSTIRQAGKGAFARRFIPKGNVIIPAPLLCTWGRRMFEMKGDHLPDDVNQMHLIYNYQYAHPDSSVLFFPTNTAITINHQSNRGHSRTPPNAELRWSAKDKKSMYYLQRPLEALKQEHYATMVLEFVATRDIYPDEEVFIDYGEEWEEAWNAHVHNYEPPCPVDKASECLKSSKAVAAMNDEKFNPNFHSWSEEHFTVCLHEQMPTSDDDNLIMLRPLLNDSGIEDKADKDGAVDGSDGDYVSSFRGIPYDDEGFDLMYHADVWYPCKILRGAKEDGVFDVVYFTAEQSVYDNMKDARFLRRARTLPSDALKFLNKPYRSDMFWKGAFRHEIKIPDRIFPALWKDLLTP